MSSLRDDIISVVDKELEKTCGAGSISLTEVSDCGIKEWIPTGSILLESIIHRPGIPVGRLTAIIGRPAAGKSTALMELMKSTQRIGGLVVLMDTEHTYDPSRAALIGIDNSKILLYQDLALEDVFATITRMADVSIKAGSPEPILIGVDSHSGTCTRAELAADDDATRAEIGSSARVTSLHLRRLISSGLLNRGRIALVFVCQLKSVVSQWGAPETYIAEKPIYYHSSLILKFTRRAVLKHGDGLTAKVKVTKSKVGPPFQDCEIDILNDGGVDDSSALLDIAVEHDLVRAKGRGHFETGGKSFRKRQWRKLLGEEPSLRRALYGLASGLLTSGD